MDVLGEGVVVKTTFLNGEEEVHMKQPKRFVVPNQEHKVCKLVRSLHGLKQAPKQWDQKFDEVVLKNGFHINNVNKCVYSMFNATKELLYAYTLMICLYLVPILIKSRVTKSFCRKTSP